MKFELVEFGTLFAEPTRNGLTRPKAVRGVGTKMVNMGELFAHSRIRDVTMDRVPLNEVEATKFLLCGGDLLFARQSLVLEGAGKCSIFLGDSEPVTFESHVTRVRLDLEKADPLFYFYYLQSPHGVNAIRSIVEQGAGASGIRGSDLKSLGVQWAGLEDQRAIAHILGSLDDKIELNGQMNQTLDEIARTLFRSWFVDFDPVRAKAEGREPEGIDAETAALFPDRFVDSALGPIPEGWEWGQLDQIADNVRVNVPVNELVAGDNYVGLEHFGKRQIALYDWGSADEVTSNKSRFLENDVLFGKLRPYFHKVSLAPINGVSSTDILVIRPKEPDYLAWVLTIASSDAMVEQATQRSSGTRMPRANWSDVGGFTIAVPPDLVRVAFARIVQPMLELVKSDLHESRTLMDLRDVLLPELLSGRLATLIILDADAASK